MRSPTLKLARIKKMAIVRVGERIALPRQKAKAPNANTGVMLTSSPNIGKFYLLRDTYSPLNFHSHIGHSVIKRAE
jgi:hypothetical protein